MSLGSLSKFDLLNILIVLRSESVGGECLSRGLGKLVGPLQKRDHGVEGSVYVVDENIIFIDSFIYDGKGPDAYFWVGNTAQPSANGSIVLYPAGATGGLVSYDGPSVLLHLPGDMRVTDIKWLAVWCKEAGVSYGDVKMPKGLIPPRPRLLPEFSRVAHYVKSGNITILDGKTFHIPKLYYDGKGRSTFFMVGTGSKPNVDGIKVPDEVGSWQTLRRYSGRDVTIRLPGHYTACDINWLAIFCVRYDRNFGHVRIPKDLDVPPDVGQNSELNMERKTQSGAAIGGSYRAAFVCFIHFTVVEI